MAQKKNQIQKMADRVTYALDSKGVFTISQYNEAKPFSSFFPGIAGIDGIPMWAFYVNRGQGIASFGVESKDKAILEFQPANKSYRLATLQGFRTFIKIKQGSKVSYWEPFQNHLIGTDFKKKQKFEITAHDLTIEEANEDLGLVASVNYFTMPHESYAALVRRLTIKNLNNRPLNIEVIDGLPAIVPYGLSDWLNKNLARTIEAWVKVRNLEQKAPYYQLNVEVSDKPEVKHIKEGNFYFAFDAKSGAMLDPIVEATCLFGAALDFAAPEKFLNGAFSIPSNQMTDNKTATAMGYCQTQVAAKSSLQIVSMFGYAKEEGQLAAIVAQAKSGKFIERKAKDNEILVQSIKNYALTVSSSPAFNAYAGHTFLDNILRGGLPISIKTKEGNVAFNVYSRKHGDLERDYNHFLVAPTFYSQGNGNYRDVNQNRRNDVWFNQDVKETHLVNFLNLIQADGYNPLIVKGTVFTPVNVKDLSALVSQAVSKIEDQAQVEEFILRGFLPGELLRFIDQKNIKLKIQPIEFLSKALEICKKKESAEHGEGFWSDHWAYNLDLLESYFGIYPGSLKELLLDHRHFSFYHDSHYVLPREQRYILTDKGVRQYASVHNGTKEIHAKAGGNILKAKNGEGHVYETHLAGKLLCLIANKVASLDPSGIGVEMEADKPNWYDALNGLPGLLGSSVSETFEIKRFSQFLLESFKNLNLSDNTKISVFEELATFISGLSNLLTLESDALAYWNKSNDVKERYRKRVRVGIEGEEKPLTVGEIKNFLEAVVKKTNAAAKLAKNKEGQLITYFYHEVTDYQVLDKGQSLEKTFVKPLKFKRHGLPLFLEGYVHAMRAQDDEAGARELYRQVRSSDLFDKSLGMYKVNASLQSAPEDIGRTRVFPRGWLENESVWLHMEYKFLLELLRQGLYDEFYENFEAALIPFQSPKRYGRNILENSSFIVSSAHQDKNLHGQGFVARLSGSTAEFIHMWLLMNAGSQPFTLDSKGKLALSFHPILKGELFTKKANSLSYIDKAGREQKAELPANTYTFMFLDSILTTYHNPKRKDTFGKNKASVKEIHVFYPTQKRAQVIKGATVSSPLAEDIRERKVERVQVYLQ